MNIVVLLPWIALSALLAHGYAVSTGATCGAHHTRLLLLADVRHVTNVTITRLKNIVSYFINKVKDGIIKTLNVGLVDPFQNKTVFNLTEVNSPWEITFAIDQLVQSNKSCDDNDDLTNLFMALEYSIELFSNGTADDINHKQHVIVLLSRCHKRSNAIIWYVNRIISLNSNVLSWFIVLELSQKIDPKIDTKNDYMYDKIVYIDSKDDFNHYNPVTLDHCQDCPVGWTRYTWSGNRISCYLLDIWDTPISWSNASCLCESFKSSLPVIETEHELKFLIDLLQTNNTIRTADLNVTETTMTAVVNVGLLKRFGLRQHHYMWTNLRPFNLEVSFESHDSRDRCVALSFPFNAFNLIDVIKWKIVYCDEPISRILVCEMEGKKIHNYTQIIDKIERAAQISQSINFNVTSWELETYVGENLIESWGMFHCQDYYDKNVSYRLVCDGSLDCNNGRDEQYCKTLSSKEMHSKYLCINPNGVGDYPTRASIPLEARCNVIQDCPDNSDEQGCDGCLGRQCHDRTCLPSHWLSRDRDYCHLFIGSNRIVYLNVSYPCKGQCSGLVQFKHEISFCNENATFQQYSEIQRFYKNHRRNLEWSQNCLYLRGTDGSPIGCHNKHHLRDCTTFQCPEGFLKCPEAYCVPLYNFGDGILDCPYGEDEKPRFNLFDGRNYIVPCWNSDIFIHIVHKCDGVPQCPYGEDETHCDVTCPTGFKCDGQAVEVGNHTFVKELKSLNVFDIKTKFLNLSGVDLSKLKDIFIFPNLLEIHASTCNLVDLGEIFDNVYGNNYLYTANLSYNNLKVLTDFGPLFRLQNLQFLNLSHNKQLSEIGYYSVMSQKLHTLDLSFTGISYFDLYIFKTYNTIQYLNLYHSNIVNIGSFQEIKPLSLEYFNLQKTSISAENMKEILQYISVTSALYVNNYTYCCPQISTGGTPKHACHAPSEAFSSCEDLLSDLLKRSLLWLVAGVSLVGNIVVVTYRLFYDRGVFKKGYGIFVTNLSVSDFVMGVYLLIIASTDVRYRDEYVLHENDWRHSALCQTAGFLSTLSSETSTFFVFLITLDRCLVIRFPFGDHRFTKLGLVLSVLFSWLLGFILASIPLIYPEWIIYSSNGMCLGLPLAIGRNPGWHYSFGVFICFNFILFLCIACGQLLIFRLVLPGHSFQMPNAQSVARRMQDIKVAKQLFLVVLSNFLCWFPICVLGFLSLTGYSVSPDTYAWLVVFVMPLNAAVNPMIYTIPAMYSKWQDFKTGESTWIHSRVNKPETLETTF